MRSYYYLLVEYEKDRKSKKRVYDRILITIPKTIDAMTAPNLRGIESWWSALRGSHELHTANIKNEVPINSERKAAGNERFEFTATAQNPSG